MRYGDNRTIHKSGFLDVEIDGNGDCVAVWFRCLRLPFNTSKVDTERADEMRDAYKRDPAPSLVAVEVADENEPTEDAFNAFREESQAILRSDIPEPDANHQGLIDAFFNTNQSALRSKLEAGLMTDKDTQFDKLMADVRSITYARPIPTTYRHIKCGTKTTMTHEEASLRHRSPNWTSSAFCKFCDAHFNIQQFVWLDGTKVGGLNEY